MKNIDDKDEMFVVVDKNDNVIGTATREECRSNNKIIHRGVYLIILNDNKVLLQRRSKKKDVMPNKFDVSVAGHVSYGETYEQTIIREAKEELGIDINHSDLIPIEKLHLKAKTESEIDMIFVAKSKTPTSKMKINRKEVSWILYFEISKIKEMLKNNENQFTNFFPYVFNSLCKHFRW